MLDQKTRKILYFDIFIKQHPDDSPEFTLDESLELLQERLDKDQASMYLKKETAAIRIKEIQKSITNKTVTMLINYSDKNISDPVFGNLTTGKLREEPKLEGEGVAVSAHLVISLGKCSSGGHLAVFEYVPGLNRGIVQPFINSELRKSSTYTFKSQNGNDKKCRPKFYFEALEGQNLKDDLARGSLKSFELVKYRKAIKDFDQDDEIEPLTSTVEFHVKKHLGLTEAFSLIEKMRNNGKEKKYSEIRIKFKNKYGKFRTVSIGTNSTDAANILYGKYEITKTKNSIRQCTNEIHEELAENMQKLLALEIGKEHKQ